MLSLTQPRSPASSPNFHYAPAQAQSLPASPLSRRDSKSRSQIQLNLQGLLQKPTTPQRSRYVDASTQWVSPVMNFKMEPPSELGRVESEVKKEPVVPSTTVSAVPSGASNAPPSPSKPILQPQSPSAKRRQSREGPSPNLNTQKSPPKRARSGQTEVKLLPAKYEFCEIEDMVILIANMISELIQTNDSLPSRGSALTRFHSRTPPGISVLDYLQRLAKHATLTPPILLSMVYYIDRLCSLYPAFTVTTLTIHRFLITAATVASKGLSDSFWNNATYARVGGIKIAELGLLELDFLYRVDWKIVPNPEVLVEYYHGLVKRSEYYEIEDSSSSLDEDDENDVESNEASEDADLKSEEKVATDVKWKAWMDDVSTKKAEPAEASDSKDMQKA
ncbi:cyclin-domain-containing protein [Tricladium varicosporioides]|nr:cyclin-domain-containing protein [Hymenoscyphus varicosporioides]